MIQDEKVRFSEGCDHGGFRPLTSIVGGLSSFLAVSQPSAADLGWPTPAGESTDERGVMRFYAEGEHEFIGDIKLQLPGS